MTFRFRPWMQYYYYWKMGSLFYFQIWEHGVFRKEKFISEKEKKNKKRDTKTLNYFLFSNEVIKQDLITKENIYLISNCRIYKTCMYSTFY